MENNLTPQKNEKLWIEIGVLALWGNRLGARELHISETIGWIGRREEPQQHWQLTERAPKINKSIFVNGELRFFNCDIYAENLLRAKPLLCLDRVFSADCSTSDFELRKLLTLLSFLAAGKVGCYEMLGALWFVDPDLVDDQDAIDAHYKDCIDAGMCDTGIDDGEI